MCGEAVAIACVFGILDDQALVLGDLEASDSSHQLGAARVTRTHEVPQQNSGGMPPPPCVGQPEPHVFTKAVHHLF